MKNRITGGSMKGERKGIENEKRLWEKDRRI